MDSDMDSNPNLDDLMNLDFSQIYDENIGILQPIERNVKTQLETIPEDDELLTPVDVGATAGAGEGNPEGPEKGNDSQKQEGKTSNRKPSDVWLGFHKPVMCSDGKQRAKCKYCPKQYVSNTKTHGTSTLKNHLEKCLFNPTNIEKNKQKTLTFKTSDSAHDRRTLECWSFDEKACRAALASMLVIDELPFRFVEGEGFRLFMKVCCPNFRIPSRTTMTRDVYQFYIQEKMKLKNFFKTKQVRVSLTTDTWTSNQQINYMVITVHFIDDHWLLHKKILNFVPITSHKGEDIGKGIEKCLGDWGINNLMCITVDNASANDTAMVYLKKKLAHLHGNVLEARFIHMRCMAHILNLVVTDGMKMLGRSIEKVRASVRFVKQSPARVQKFKKCIKSVGIESKGFLILDVPTRWNSCYLMLKSACNFEKAFELYEDKDHFYKTEMNSKIRNGESEPLGLLCDDDWVVIKRLMKFLEFFYELTIRVSGSKYVTCNLFLDEISDTYTILNEALSDPDVDLRNMAYKMKDKFDKYWGDVHKMNLLSFIARVFDPRFKLDFVLYVVENMYPVHVGNSLAALITQTLNELFVDYTRVYAIPSNNVASASQSNVSADSNEKPRTGVMTAQFKKFKSSHDGNVRSELEKYLKEDLEPDSQSGFNLLKWWRDNSSRFPILSKMARDILAIPISTVSSESAFSTGGRVLNDFRSSLSPRVVQALICTQDWIRQSNTPMRIEEDLLDMDTLEDEFSALGLEQLLQI